MENVVNLLNAKLSLPRHQPRAGPDGGDGGSGGSIVLIADSSVKEFAHLHKHIKAENGGDGRADECKGKNGSDCTCQVNVICGIELLNNNKLEIKLEVEHLLI